MPEVIDMTGDDTEAEAILLDTPKLRVPKQLTGRLWTAWVRVLESRMLAYAKANHKFPFLEVRNFA